MGDYLFLQVNADIGVTPVARRIGFRRLQGAVQESDDI
jgi:hypothetical protein